MTKAKTDWKNSYKEYLTRKLDKGAPNIVVDTVTKTLEELDYSRKIRVAEIGCFTGSLLNRIYLNLPLSKRKKVEFWGLDIDREIIDLASRQRPHIIFKTYDISKSMPTVLPFDIIIISNTLHEVYSDQLPNKGKARNTTKKAIKNVSNLLRPGGYLVLLDGVMPNKPNRIVKVQFLDSRTLKAFISFSESNYITPITYSSINSNTLQMSLASLSAFLTKGRYLKEKYWENEAKQVYQYFTINEFNKILKSNKLEVKETFPQAVNRIEEKILILDSTLEIPYKNILIKARKTS